MGRSRQGCHDNRNKPLILKRRGRRVPPTGGSTRAAVVSWEDLEHAVRGSAAVSSSKSTKARWEISTLLPPTARPRGTTIALRNRIAVAWVRLIAERGHSKTWPAAGGEYETTPPPKDQ